MTLTEFRDLARMFRACRISPCSLEGSKGEYFYLILIFKP